MKSLSVLILMILMFTDSLYSQNIINVRGLSMGKTSVSDSYEIDAFNNNPANIAKQKTGNDAVVYFNIFTNLNYHMNSEYFSFDFYNKYFTKNSSSNRVYLTNKDKSDIVNSVSGQPVSAFANLKDLSIIYNTKESGSFGISLDESAAGSFILNKDFVELGLYGNEVGRVYDLSEINHTAGWVRQLNLTYAKNLILKSNKLISDISIGASVKPQFGLYYTTTQSNDLSVVTNSNLEIQGNGQIVFLFAGTKDNNEIDFSFNPAGFGFGFDIGFNAGIKNISKKGKLNFGLSMNDLGYINWTQNTNEYIYNGEFIVNDITDPKQLDSLVNVIKSSKVSVQNFSTALPANLRIGFTYKIFSQSIQGFNTNNILETASLSIEYIQGFPNDFGFTTKPFLGIGGEYNINDIFSPRMGFCFGGNEKFVMSLGLGIDAGPVMLDLGTYNISNIYNSQNTSKISGAFSIKFKIN